MPEGLLSAIHLVLQTREARTARLNATYSQALRAATNSTIGVTAGIWHTTRAGLLRVVNELGRFDIGESVITVGPKMQDAPPKVFLTVFRRTLLQAVDRL